MSLIEKIKNIFKKEEGKKIQQARQIASMPESKYENMVLLAPTKTVYEDDGSNYYVNVYDENNDPVSDEVISIKLPNKTYDIKTNENGLLKIPVSLTPGKYVFDIVFPNGEYSQSIEGKLIVKEAYEKPTKSKKSRKSKTVSESLARIYAPNLKMYSKKQTAYYIVLRDYEYNPIPDQEIKFTINEDEVYTVKTDERGFARLNKEFQFGKYKIQSEFLGNDKYDPVKKTRTLKVLMRNEDRELVIDVDHLTMEFKVTKDKIDTLKEFIIRSIKRNKEKHEKIRVIDDISFKVYKGDKLGILGFNGAGKSTLLKIMSGIYEPTSGSITTYGKIAPLLELGAGFDKNYTGKNNIFLNGAFLSMDENFLKEKYDEIVEFSELGEFINYPIKNYSSGMKSKLGFAIATTINPDILIVDEILSVGDIKFKKKSSEKINSLMKDGVTVLLVSHSIPQIRKICDRCIWLQDGQVIMDDDANKVCNAYMASVKGKGSKKKKK